MQYDVIFAAPLSGTTAAVSAGNVLCKSTDGSSYTLATDAAMAAVGGLPTGVSNAVGNASQSVSIQVSGLLAKELSGLSDASTAGLGPMDTAYAVRSSTGTLVRKVAPTAGDHVLGVVLPDGSVRLEPAYIWAYTVNVSDFTDRSISVSSATSAPANLTTFGDHLNTFAAGQTYQFAYSYLGHDGVTESALSPASASFVNDGVSSIWLKLPSTINVSLRAPAIRWYINQVSGENRWRIAVIAASDRQTHQPCDGGVHDVTLPVCFGYLTGAFHPGTDNATTFNATHIAAPTGAPSFVKKQNVPLGTYQFAVAYRAQNLGLTDKGPSSSPVTNTYEAGGIYMSLPEPPLGACSTLILGSNNGGTTWYIQDEIVVGASAYYLYNWSTSSPWTGHTTATSTVSAIQWAWEAIRAVGSGTVELPPGQYSIYCPLRLASDDALYPRGMRLRALGYHGITGNSTSSAIVVYRGPSITGATCIAHYALDKGYIQGVGFIDEGALTGGTSRCDYGLHFSAWTAGQCFNGTFRDVTIMATKVGSVGVFCGPSSNSPPASTSAALMYFDNCALAGDYAGIEWHNQQSVSNTFNRCSIYSWNSATTALAADIKMYGGKLTFRSCTSLGFGHAVFLISDDDIANRNSGISTQVDIDGFYCEMYAAIKGVCSSGLGGSVNNQISLKNVYTLPNSAWQADVYSVLLAAGSSSARASGDYMQIDSSVLNGRLHRFSPNARVLAPGLSEGTYMSTVASPDYTATVMRAMGALAFYNENTVLDTDGPAKLTTNSYGDLAALPKGGVYIANATTVPAANRSGGGVLYVEAGALKYRGSGGTVTVLGPA